MLRLRVLITLVACLGPSGAGAASIGITGYNIINADVSGTGNWAHVYTGLIAPTAGSLANYSGGTGTMADGVFVGTNADNTQLFLTSAPNVGIALFLDNFYSIDQIDIFGGDHGAIANNIPGAITGMDVTINATTQTFATTGFGPINMGPGPPGYLINDRVTITGSSLDGLFTNQIFISNVTSAFAILGQFSIAEIQINGTLIPEPSGVLLFSVGMLVVGRTLRRRAA
jgi:hypothetical protein